MGSATNAVALQVGGALGVAVLGTVWGARYQGQLGPVLNAWRVPPPTAHAMMASPGNALSQADRVSGTAGPLLARAARAAFLSGMRGALVIGAGIAAAGAVLVLARLPDNAGPAAPGPTAAPPVAEAAPVEAEKPGQP